MSDGKEPRNAPGQPPELGEIAKWVLGIAGGAIIGVSAIVLVGAAFAKPDKFLETSQSVFNALLPLLGTWVGTVLAYYFSSKNFESASQSVERMVNLTTEQKLGQLFVEKEMLRPDQITMSKLPVDGNTKGILLKDLREMFVGKVTRIPVVDSNFVVKYIVHQSGLYKFLSDQAMQGTVDIKTLTLEDLITDAELQNWVTNIVYLSAGASVAEAKKVMEEQKGCQDLIVTASGTNKEPILGWMTNADIGRLSKA